MPSFDFDLDSADDAGGRCRVTARGELDLGTVDRVEAAVSDGFARGRAVLLDLRGLAFLDSSGIRLLLTAREQAVTAGQAFTVAVPADGEVRAVLVETGIIDLLELEAGG